MRTIDLYRLLLLSAIWGASFMCLRVLTPVLGPITTAFSRVALGALGLGLFVLLSRRTGGFHGHLKASLVLGVISAGVPFLLYAVAARHLPAGYSAIMNAMTPLMGIVIGMAFFGEKTGAKGFIGVALGLMGVAVLTLNGPVRFNAGVALGALLCLLATACYATAGFLTKRWVGDRGGLDAKWLALGGQLGATLFLLPFLGFTGTASQPMTTMGVEAWAALLVLGLVCTSWAFILYFQLLADVGPARSFTVTFLIPPFGVLWGAVLLNEQITWAHGMGGGLILAALGSIWQRPAAAVAKQDA